MGHGTFRGMKWFEARAQHPERWLLIEAVSAHTQKAQRLVGELSIVADFEASNEALQAYLELHRREPQRELYVVHTSRKELDIEERRWAGIRVPEYSNP